MQACRKGGNIQGPGGGGQLHISLPRMCGLKLERNGSFLGMEGGIWSTSTWVYCVEGLHLYGSVSRELTPIWLCF